MNITKSLFLWCFVYINCTSNPPQDKGVLTPSHNSSSGLEPIYFCHINENNLTQYDFEEISFDTITHNKACVVEVLLKLDEACKKSDDSSAMKILDKISCYVFDRESDVCETTIVQLFYYKFDMLLRYLLSNPNSCMRDSLIHGLNYGFLASEGETEQELLAEIDKHVKKNFSRGQFSPSERAYWFNIRKEIHYDPNIQLVSKADVLKKIAVQRY